MREKSKSENILLPFLLSPCPKECVWGGERLSELYGKSFGISHLGETWECSAHPSGESTAASGIFKGMKLGEILREYPSLLGGRNELPVLIKLIDARERLSVQVHPGDEYARLHEGQSGKTEMWYILDALPGAELILGFDKRLDRSEAMAVSRSGGIEHYLRHVGVKRGDAYLIEPGTVHAIGAGVLLAEIQQSSDVTYRLWDYGRNGTDGRPRELHLDRALDVAILDNREISPLAPRTIDESCSEICVTPYFRTCRIEVRGEYRLIGDTHHAGAMLCVDGGGELVSAAQQLLDNCCAEPTGNYLEAYQLAFGKGDCVFIPAGAGELKLRGNTSCLLVSF